MIGRQIWDRQMPSGGGGKQASAVTAEEFLSTPIYGQYTPMTLEDWFAIMKSYPDIYLVTDTKFSENVPKQFGLFVDTAVENGYENVLSRVIVQIYYAGMYDEVAAVYPFKNWIWTLYYIGWSDSTEIIDFMNKKNIPVLTVPSSWWDEGKRDELAESGIKVYVHTVNDEEEAQLKITQGVSGIYSDDIQNTTFRQWQEKSE